MYETSCEMLYDMISRRIRFKQEHLRLKSTQILPGEPDLIRAIRRNRRHEGKNEYLIPAGASRPGEPKNHAKTIAGNLKFASARCLLWGNSAEIKAYSMAFLMSLIGDALDSGDARAMEAIGSALEGHAPYAACRRMNGNGTDPRKTEFFDEAALRLCNRLSGSFPALLREFLYRTESTGEIDGALAGFVAGSLLPAVENLPEDPVCREIRALPNEDLPDGPVGHGLAALRIRYVSDLCRLQRELDPLPDRSLVWNAWKPELCLA